VHIWFSEDLIPQTSRIVVVDTTNHEVDNRDTTVIGTAEMSVSLPLLPAGTYVVVWRSQSAVDGHIAEGSFLFRVARPDGTVPPIPAILPTGNVPGAAGIGTTGSGTLDGPTLLQTLMTWLALLGMTFWVGGVIWETWILPPGTQQDADLAAASKAAGERFQRLAPYALGGVFLADLGIVLGQSAALAGEWSGAFSWPLLHVIVFGSHFGTFWWMRQLVALAALALLWLERRVRREAKKPEHTSMALQTTPLDAGSSALKPSKNWWRSVLESMRDIRYLPRQLVNGWVQQPWLGKGGVLIGACFLLVFALSGHAAAVSPDQLWYALGNDLLHLIGTTVWVGGLLYIGGILVPTLFTLNARQRASVLVQGLPAFSALAILTVSLLAATGSVNTTVHLTQLSQFLTTLYGQTLAVKIGLFLIMIAISAFHAFALRPRLARLLAQRQQSQAQAVTVATDVPRGTASVLSHAQNRRANAALYGKVRKQSERLANWLQIEALIGAAVLLCVALLAAFAGTLAPTSAASGTPGQAAPAASPFTQTQHAHGYALTLRVAPASFGTNTFTVTLEDARGQPLPGAAVLVETTMLDMDMGTQTTQLSAVPTAPGTYQGQSDLTMAGRWAVTIRVLPPKEKTFVQYRFTFSAG
jgi:putative copper export protein